MSSFRKIVLFIAATILFCTMFTQEALAVSRGGGAASSLSGAMSLGLGFSYTGSDQSDLNGTIDSANTATPGGISTKNLGSSYETFANWIYRFDRSAYALVIRPSYLWQSSTGSSNTGGSYNYKLSGFSVFPMFRLYPLENSFIHFFMQGGLGYGSLNGDVTVASNNVQFKGSAFGAMGGNCTAANPIAGFSQCTSGSEVERNGNDLQTSMSGVQVLSAT